MELDGVRRVVYWVTYGIFMILVMLFMTAERLTLLFRVILLVLLAFLSSMFRFEEYYSAFALLVTVPLGFFTGAVLANNSTQFWALSFIWFIVFFGGCEILERKMLKFIGV
ncbi:hypothetical protein KY362_00825 [Candidatus Woesearchaeota archaeon]|nr:hypothetical protein [Candidatus Woesearchaeota archaeon]